MFGLGNKDKGNSKVVVKTKKGRQPVEKVKVQLHVTGILAVLAALGLLGYIPEELHNPTAELIAVAISALQALVSYLKRPGEDDGVEIQG